MPAQTVSSGGAVHGKSTRSERRTAVRYACLRECIVRPELETSAVEDWWSAMAYNISATGIGVGLLYPLPVGTVLAIEPRGWKGGRGVRARVVRSVLESYVWFHGCEFFNPLGERELRGWLAVPPPVQE
jgi:hypothetical protein